MQKIQKKPSRNLLDRFLSDIELIDVESRDLYEVATIDELADEPLILKMSNLIGMENFINSLSDFQVHFAIGSNSTQLVSADNFRNFVEKTMIENTKKYAFHNVTKDPELMKIMPDLIPIPKFLPVQNMNDLRICRLYAGAKYSGTNLHNHSAALNFLVSGRKLWITFPSTEKNIAFVKEHKMQYGYVTDTALNWLYQNYRNLVAENAVDNLNVFIQKTGEITYVPTGHFHAIVNLENSIGITYSWN